MRVVSSLRSLLPALALALVAGGCQPDEQKLAEHLERAETYVEEGKVDEAIIEYKNVLQIDPNHADAHYGLARAYLRNRKAREGFWELRETVRLDPQNLEARLQFGQLSVYAGELEEALKQAEAVIEAEPDDRNAHLLKAEVLEAQKQPQEARAAYERALEIDPESRVALLVYANFLRRQGDRDAAEPVYRKLAELHPGFPTWSALAGFLMQDRGRDDEAEAAYQKALELAEEDERSRAYAALSGFYFSRNRTDEAVATLEEGIEKQEEPLDLIYLLARFHRALGNDAQAEELIVRATDARPDEPRTHLILSSWHGRKGDLEAALAAAEKARQADPESDQAKLRVAEVLVELGYRERERERERSTERIARGRGIVEAMLAKEPSHGGALFVKAKLDLAEGDVDEAVQALRSAIDARPDWAQAHFVLGTALAVQGDRTAARTELARALEIDAGLLEARKVLAQVHAGLGEHEYAVEEGRRFLRERPDDAGTRILMAQSLVRLGRLEEALAELESIPEEQRGLEVLYALGRTHLGRGDLEQARSYVERAAAMRPDHPDILLTLMDLDRRQGRVEDSVQRIRAAVEANPQSAALHRLWGVVALGMGQVEEAEASLRRAIEVNPDDLAAYRQLASLYAGTQRLDEAIRTYEKALEVRSDNAHLHHFLGVLYEYAGNTERAMERYEQALALDPDLAEAKNNLAYLFAEKSSELDRALDLAQEAKALLPDNPNAADTLGWVLYKRGVPSAAISYLKEAEAGMDPNDQALGIVRHHLALAYEANGDTEEAVAALRRALEVAPAGGGESPEWVAEVRSMLERLDGETARRG